MIGRVHLVKRASVERVIAQELVPGSVELVRSGSSNNINLASAGASHLSGIASGLHLEFLHRVWRRTEVESVECGISVRGAVQQKIVRVRPVPANTDR